MPPTTSASRSPTGRTGAALSIHSGQRTNFLAWIRTALALAAGGLGVASLLPDFGGSELLGMLLLALSLATAASSYRRWAMSEAAMRLGEALSKSRLPQLMASGVLVVALLAALLFGLDQL